MAIAIATAIGTAYQAYTQSEAQKSQAKVAEKNAEYAAEAAANKDEQEQLNRRSERKEQRHEQRKRRSVMEAAYAKSGVLLDGTPSNYLIAQTETDQLNVSRADQVSQTRRTNILYEGQLQANEYMNKANALKSAARSTLIGGAIKIAGSAFSSWAEMDDKPKTKTPKTKTTTSSTSGGTSGGGGGSGGY